MMESFKEKIDALQLEKIEVVGKKEEEGHIELIICGGFNGKSDWEVYIQQIGAIVSTTKGYVIDLKCDVPDDKWYLTLGILKSLEERFEDSLNQLLVAKERLIRKIFDSADTPNEKLDVMKYLTIKDLLDMGSYYTEVPDTLDTYINEVDFIARRENILFTAYIDDVIDFVDEMENHSRPITEIRDEIINEFFKYMKSSNLCGTIYDW